VLKTGSVSDVERDRKPFVSTFATPSAELAIGAGEATGQKENMDKSIYALTHGAHLAQLQRDAIEPLLKQARLVLITDAMPQADRTDEQDSLAREAAASLAQAILLLDHNLRKIIAKERTLVQPR
jgi:hypothetical protein